MRDPTLRRRRSVRMSAYDYSQAGYYFVTLCTYDRECVLGEISDDRMVLSEAGRAVEAVWARLPQRFPSVELDAFVVMPNHVHGIVVIVDRSISTLGAIVGAFKSLAAIEVNHLLSRSGRPLWQRSFYEHVVRNDRELDRFRAYVAANPSRWPTDAVHPDNPSRW